MQRRYGVLLAFYFSLLGVSLLVGRSLDDTFLLGLIVLPFVLGLAIGFPRIRH